METRSSLLGALDWASSSWEPDWAFASLKHPELSAFWQWASRNDRAWLAWWCNNLCHCCHGWNRLARSDRQHSEETRFAAVGAVTAEGDSDSWGFKVAPERQRVVLGVVVGAYPLPPLPPNPGPDCEPAKARRKTVRDSPRRLGAVTQQIGLLPVVYQAVGRRSYGKTEVSAYGGDGCIGLSKRRIVSNARRRPPRRARAKSLRGGR